MPLADPASESQAESPGRWRFIRPVEKTRSRLPADASLFTNFALVTPACHLMLAKHEDLRDG